MEIGKLQAPTCEVIDLDPFTRTSLKLGDGNASTDKEGMETRRPLKKRNLSVVKYKEEELDFEDYLGPDLLEKILERTKMVDISYPGKPMMSIAEILDKLAGKTPRIFKTSAEKKEMPPPPLPPEPTAGDSLNVPAKVVTEQYNNLTYNNPTIGYHRNNVPYPFFPSSIVPMNSTTIIDMNIVHKHEQYQQQQHNQQLTENQDPPAATPSTRSKGESQGRMNSNEPLFSDKKRRKRKRQSPFTRTSLKLGDVNASTDKEGMETRLPLKKRNLSVVNNKGEELDLEDYLPPDIVEEEDISYSSKPMMSIAEILDKLAGNTPRIKTSAEKKEMPPPPLPPEPTAGDSLNFPAIVITEQYNNPTYNNPTIGYHRNNVPPSIVPMNSTTIIDMNIAPKHEQYQQQQHNPQLTENQDPHAATPSTRSKGESRGRMYSNEPPFSDKKRRKRKRKRQNPFTRASLKLKMLKLNRRRRRRRFVVCQK